MKNKLNPKVAAGLIGLIFTLIAGVALRLDRRRHGSANARARTAAPITVTAVTGTADLYPGSWTVTSASR